MKAKGPSFRRAPFKSLPFGCPLSLKCADVAQGLLSRQLHRTARETKFRPGSGFSRYTKYMPQVRAYVPTQSFGHTRSHNLRPKAAQRLPAIRAVRNDQVPGL